MQTNFVVGTRNLGNGIEFGRQGLMRGNGAGGFSGGGLLKSVDVTLGIRRDFRPCRLEQRGQGVSHRVRVLRDATHPLSHIVPDIQKTLRANADCLQTGTQSNESSLEILGASPKTLEAGDDPLETDLVVEERLERTRNSADSDAQNSCDLHIGVFGSSRELVQRLQKIDMNGT